MAVQPKSGFSTFGHYKNVCPGQRLSNLTLTEMAALFPLPASVQKGSRISRHEHGHLVLVTSCVVRVCAVVMVELQHRGAAHTPARLEHMQGPAVNQDVSRSTVTLKHNRPGGLSCFGASHMEREGLSSYTAPGHQVAVQLFWLPFAAAPVLFVIFPNSFPNVSAGTLNACAHR